MFKKITRKQRRLLAIALASVMAITSLAIGLGGTLAAKPPVIADFALQPNAYPIIAVGQTVERDILGAAHATSSNAAIATTPSGRLTGPVEITGAGAGVAVISVGSTAGLVRGMNYQVYDNNNIVKYTIANGGEVLFSAPNKSVANPVTAETGVSTSAANAAAFGAIQWHSVQPGIADIDQTTGIITAKANGIALIIGEFIDKWGVWHDLHITVGVGTLNDNLIPGPDDDGDGEPDYWYRRLGRPPNVYEILDEDKNSKYPPEYIYNEDGDPGNGNDKPAIPNDGAYWVEDPEGSNIWKPVGEDGGLDEDGAIWGGENGKPGGGDDAPVKKFGSGWWVHMGQNVWRKVNPNGDDNTELGELTGGGLDGDPTTQPGTPIYYDEREDKYFLGPFEDDDGGHYFYGDPETGGNGKLDSDRDRGTNPKAPDGDDVVWWIGPDGEWTTTKPPKVKLPNEVVGETFMADGFQWLVLKADAQGNLLITTTSIVGSTKWAKEDKKNRDVIYTGKNALLYPAMKNFYTTRLSALKAHARPAAFPQEAARAVTMSNYRTQTSGWSFVTAGGETTCFALSVTEIYNSPGFPDDASRGIAGTTWWTRSKAYNGEKEHEIFYINPNGSAGKDEDFDRNSRGIRPAMWISPDAIEAFSIGR